MKITQAINLWLQKLFGWWPWKKAALEASYSPVKGPVHKTVPQGTISRSTADAATSQSGASLMIGQGEANSPTSSSSSLPPISPQPMPPSPVSTSSEKVETSTEQKLEFLQYLVKRGIVNEGFAEGQTPEQYRP